MYKMSFNLTLNSSNVVNGTTNNTYQYNFRNGSFNVPEGSEMCVSQISVPYSWVNISSALGNNVLAYSIPAGSSVQYFSTILPDGFYDINALNLALQVLFKTNGHYWSVSSTGTFNTIYYYPITISTNDILYTNSFTSVTIPTSGNIVSVFGTGAIAGNWSGGGYPTTLLSTYNFASLFIQQTITAPSSLGYILGFTGGSSIISPSTSNGTFYPTIGLSSAVSQSINGNSLFTSPPFPAQGSTVNGVIIRCNLVDNHISNQTDILDSFPITSTYGSNINYLPQKDNWIKIQSGRYNNLVVYLQDQNLNPLRMLDPNCLISLLIRTPNI